MPETNVIKSITSDLHPDNYVSFYLFYFNQGLGADASFERAGRYLIHIFVGKIMTPENNETILKILDERNKLAVGEFIDILAHISDNDLNNLKDCAGATLIIDKQDGSAESKLFVKNEEIKSFITSLKRVNAKQLH
jgi:hypothetical protein